MEFKPFDTSEIDSLRNQYAEEAKARWGDTEAYRESTRRATKWTEADAARIQKESGEIFSAFAARPALCLAKMRGFPAAGLPRALFSSLLFLQA